VGPLRLRDGTLGIDPLIRTTGTDVNAPFVHAMPACSLRRAAWRGLYAAHQFSEER